MPGNHPTGTVLIVQNSAYLKYLTLSKKDQNLQDFFWLGLLMYILGYSISQTTMVSYIVCQVFQSMGILLMIAGALTQLQLNVESPYLKVIYTLYCMWLIAVMFRGMTFDYSLIKIMLFDAYFGALLYFMPLLLLFPRNMFFYKRLFDAVFVLGIAYLGLTLLFIREILLTDREDLVSRGIVEVFNRNLAIPTTFLLMTFIYQSKKKKLLAFINAGIAIILALIKARRGLLLMTMLPLLIAYIFYWVESKSKIMVVILSIFFGSTLILYGLSMYENSSVFTYLKDRGLEDTRTNVELAFWKDLNTRDILFGRGMMGEYYCPGIDEGNHGYRSVIETDYLQTILKGGIISLVLLLLILVPAMFYGLFFSKNLLSKAAGAWIFLAILNMYPSNVNTFSMYYLMVWVSVGICYSRVIRNLPEEVLKLYYNPA